jgi:hypothetical protein
VHRLISDSHAKSLVAISSVLAFIYLALASATQAENAAFDLVGPKIDVRVHRGREALPIAKVPNLEVGDRIWIHPDLPDTQSVHYLMVVVFLRGTTNPPPDSWFTRAETWAKPVHEEGILVTVPEEAEDGLILLAPETGGDFSTLKAAVRGKPGAFVRAAQDLEQASLDRARLETYLQAVRETSSSDPDQLKDRTILLARSLNIKLDQQCFDKPSLQQVPCLTQNTEQLVMDDTHTQTMVATLTSEAPTDLLARISSTPTARGGYYSPYVGAVVDVVRILGTTHTAQYQYIPALALPKKDQLNLRLNNPPSFRNPKSVLVIGLPPVRAPILPPLRAVDARQVLCADKPGLVLPAEGAPLVFATELGHSFVLHIEDKSGAGVDLPARPDPARGGFLVETQSLPSPAWGEEFSGVLRGAWGFRSFDGPRFRLRASRPGQWVVAATEASTLVVGRKDKVHLRSADASCVSDVLRSDVGAKPLALDWKATSADELEVTAPLENANPGSLKLLVRKFGMREPDEVSLRTYAEAGRLDSFSLHAGDVEGVLKGTRLDQVTNIELNGVAFTPSNLTRASGQDELKVAARESGPAAKLTAGQSVLVHVTLKDGRILDLNATVQAARPKLNLLSKGVQAEEPDPKIHVANPDELPQNARLNFFVKAQVPENFSPREKIEVATANESFRTLLTVKDGSLTLQDAKTVFAVLDPVKQLGPSAFGALKFRPLTEEGVEGDWQPLVNLVRIPELREIRCAPSPAPAETAGKQCVLSGDKLFLIDTVSADPDFSNSVKVPDGFPDATLNIPPPKGNVLYLKLRDDPGTVDTAVVPMLTAQP